MSSLELYHDMAPMVDADMPKGKEKATGFLGSAQCPQCDEIVLVGTKEDGTTAVVERLNEDSYCAEWDSIAKVYRLKKSRGYPVHRCGGKRQGRKERV